MDEPSDVRDTRAAFDAVASEYAAHYGEELTAMVVGRAMLTAFAELVLARGGGPVADLGCGPGRVTALLGTLGLEVFGVDLSPRMVDVARREHPELRFEVGSMAELQTADGALGGVVAWFSIINTPPDRMPEVFAEFHRALAPDGVLLLAFQVGDEPRHITEAFGRRVSVDFYHWSPDHIVELLTRAGFAMRSRVLSAPDDAVNIPHAHVLAHRTG